MGEVILDALLDSLKILAVLLVCNFIISLIEPKFSNNVKLKGKLAPLIGVSISLLPQCGFSIVATDLYQKRHISVGTLIGVYLATSDEAIPIFLAYPSKALHILPLIGLKFVIGLLFGYLIDLIYVKNRKDVEHHLQHCDDSYKIKLTHCEGAEVVEVNKDHHIPFTEEICQHQSHEICHCEECENSTCPHLHKEIENKDNNLLEESNKNKDSNLKQFLIKPLLHSLEIFAYVLVINILFGILIYYVGEDNIIAFLTQNKYIAPLFSVIVGIIPNCASSVIISELYIMGGLGFGATLGGLCMNAGLGFIMLFKKKHFIKKGLLIILVMFLISIFISYIFSLIFNFNCLSF